MGILHLLERSLGVNFREGKAEILLWAPHSEQVELHNLTQRTVIPLLPAEHGYWQASTTQLRPGEQYMFSLGNGQLLPDPTSLAQPGGVHKASEAVDLKSFTWTDEAWVCPDPGQFILYELHTGTFTAGGNFDGIIQQLGYLKTLGINTIELMPVAQFPGERNWGYDGVFPFAVQNSYGGADGLRQLVDTCHNKGFAVVLDVVYNHLGPEGNYLDAYGNYYTDKYKTPWGKAINFDDAYCDAVRFYFIENTLMWLRDFHIDALRLDAVHAICDYSPVHIIKAMNDAVELFNELTTSPRHLILETDLNDSRYIRSKETCGFGVRAQWCDEFHHALRVTTGQERTGYYRDYNGLADLAKSLRQGYVHTGQYAPSRHRRFGTSTEGIPADRFVVFSQNHDQVGNRMLGERSSQLVSFEMQKVMAASVLTSPYIPLLFMGEEWGAHTPFLYFTDHSDTELIRAVTEGRKAEFAHFHQEGVPLPANEKETFLRSVLDWREKEKPQHEALLRYYRELIKLRKLLLPLRNPDRSASEVLCNEEKGILILERSFKEQMVLCIFNFSAHPHEILLKETLFPLHVLLTSSDDTWDGPGKPMYVLPHHKPIDILPESVIILTNVPA